MEQWNELPSDIQLKIKKLFYRQLVEDSFKSLISGLNSLVQDGCAIMEPLMRRVVGYCLRLSHMKVPFKIVVDRTQCLTDELRAFEEKVVVEPDFRRFMNLPGKTAFFRVDGMVQSNDPYLLYDDRLKEWRYGVVIEFDVEEDLIIFVNHSGVKVVNAGKAAKLSPTW